MRENAPGAIGLMILFGVLFMVVNLFTDSSGQWIFSWSWGGFFKVVVLLLTGLFSIVIGGGLILDFFSPKPSTSDDPPPTLSDWIGQLCVFVVLPIAIFILFLRWLLV